MKIPNFLSSKYSWSFLMLLLMVPVNMGTKRVDSIGDRVEAILDDPRAASAFWGVYIKDLSTNRVLYSRNADKTLVPASNQKILTTAAALDILGKDYRYETTLHFNGQIGGSVMRGDMILEGSGDPTFASKELRSPNPMKEWATKLQSLGVTRIEGRLIGDDNVFDDEPYAEGWDLSFIANESFAPASSGLASHDNVVVVQIESSRVGAPPVLTDTPPGYMSIRNEATTSARRRGRSISVNRTLGTEDIVIKGSIPRVYRRSIVIPVSNPTLSTIHTLKHYLEEAGITVDAGLYDIDDLKESIDYRNASPLFVHHSIPMSSIITQINKESDNMYAEQVFRTFGWGGSTDGGEKRVKDLFKKAGINQAGLSVRDGSGLSRKNMISPETMGELLAYMHTHPQKDAFFSSLPRGGEAETTLDYRLKGVPVWAKTGSLEYVRTLSGYVRTADGRTMAFALLANNYTVPSYRITQAMDRIVLAMTESTDV